MDNAETGELFDLALALPDEDQSKLFELLEKTQSQEMAERLRKQLADFHAFANMLDDGKAFSDMVSGLDLETAPPPEEKAARKEEKVEPAPIISQKPNPFFKWLSLGLTALTLFVLFLWVEEGQQVNALEAQQKQDQAALAFFHKFLAIPTAQSIHESNVIMRDFRNWQNKASENDAAVDHHTRLLWGRILFALGAHMQAEKQWDMVNELTNDPALKKEAERLGNLTSEAQNQKKQLDFFNQFSAQTTHFPQFPSITGTQHILGAQLLVQHAQLLSTLQKWEEAEAIFVQAQVWMEGDKHWAPSLPYTQLLRAVNLQNRGQFTRAEALLIESLSSIPPKSAMAPLIRSLLVQHYTLRGDQASADKYRRE